MKRFAVCARFVGLGLFFLLFFSCNRHSVVMVPVEQETDFLLLLDKAEITAENPEFVHPAIEEIGGARHWGIFQHAPSAIRYRNVYIGEEAVLDFAIGILPTAWSAPGDGVRFQISAILPSGETQSLFSQYINPKAVSDHRKWLPQTVAVDKIRNTTADIEFRTFPGETNDSNNNNSDFAVWGIPRLLSKGRNVPHQPISEKPNIILITIDTCRADFLGCYGNSWIRTPAIDRLADNGVLFEKMSSAASTTNPSHASILTSLNPYAHGVISNLYFLAASLPRLPQILKEIGYKTFAATSVYHLNSDISGLGRYFDAYDEVNSNFWSARLGHGNLATLTRPGASTTTAAIRKLEEVHNAPFFLWVHYYDPHAPYEANDEFHLKFYSGDPSSPSHHSMEDAKFQIFWGDDQIRWIQPFRDLNYFKKEYGAEISYTDHHIGRLLDALRRLHLEHNTIVVLTGDHGENLGDHGIYFDHWTLFNSDLHVPLIIYYPKQVPSLRIPTPVTGIDIAPTILDLIGEKENSLAKKIFEGRSLRPLWEKRSQWKPRILTADGLLYTEIAAWDDRYKCVWELRPAIYHEDFKLFTDRVSVYDEQTDPEENNPVARFYWRNVKQPKPDDPWREEKTGAPPPMEESKLKDKLLQTRERASKKAVPTPDELQAWFAEQNGHDVIRDDLKQDAAFFGRVVAFLEILRAQVAPLTVRDRIKDLHDLGSLQAAEAESLQKQDKRLQEYLRSLGYVSQ